MYQSKDRARFSRAQWMERYETELLKRRPNLRGKIDWGNAHYHYGQGLTPMAAADKEVGK